MSNVPFRTLSHVGSEGHEYPGYPSFPRYTFDVVSPELPCGASWLASVLLETNVPIWNPWNVDMSLEWRHLGERQFEYHYPGDPWSRVISGLITGRRFNFFDSVVPRFSHDIPGNWSPSDRLIIFVRDPRDALFSAWRRLQGTSKSVPSFSTWVAQTDSVWQAPRIAAYLLHLATWRYFAALHRTETLIVRFEDVKTNAKHEFRRIQQFIDQPTFNPTPSQIDHALAVSSFGAIKTIEEKMLNDGVFDKRINFAGQAYEYKTHFDEPMHTAIGAAGAAIYQWLGYDQPIAKFIPYSLPTLQPEWLTSVRTIDPTIIIAN